MLFTVVALVHLAASLSEVRSTYRNAVEDSEDADRLVTMTKASRNDASFRAYYGTGLALQAKHAWSPATKLSKAGEASSELNAAVNAAPTNLEVRFLRFSFEANAPSFLGYSTHLAEDKKYILAHMNASHPIWDVMRAFLRNTDQLTEAEKKKIP